MNFIWNLTSFCSPICFESDLSYKRVPTVTCDLMLSTIWLFHFDRNLSSYIEMVGLYAVQHWRAENNHLFLPGSVSPDARFFFQSFQTVYPCPALLGHEVRDEIIIAPCFIQANGTLGARLCFRVIESLCNVSCQIEPTLPFIRPSLLSSSPSL